MYRNCAQSQKHFTMALHSRSMADLPLIEKDENEIYDNIKYFNMIHIRNVYLRKIPRSSVKAIYKLRTSTFMRMMTYDWRCQKNLSRKSRICKTQHLETKIKRIQFKCILTWAFNYIDTASHCLVKYDFIFFSPDALFVDLIFNQHSLYLWFN